MLEEPHGRLQVGRVVGRTPQEWEAPRDRPIERGETAREHRVVAHRIEELDVKRVRVSAHQGGGHRLGGGTMTRASVGKEKEETLTGGHERTTSASEQPLGGAHLLARSNGDEQVIAFEHLRLRRVDAQLPTALSN